MEREPIKQADRRACARQINRLLAACKNDVLVQNSAAAIIKDPSKRARLEERARRRELFVKELDALVHSLGGSSLSRASSLVSLRGIVQRFRATLIGDNEGDAYSACSRVETKTEEAYASTLEMPLPESVRAVVARQHDEIAHDRDELRQLQFSH